MSEENKNFYKNLKQLLDDTSSWPSEYIYNLFTSPTKINIEILKDIFKDSSADFKLKNQERKIYFGFCKIIAKDPDLIINNYKKVAIGLKMLFYYNFCTYFSYFAPLTYQTYKID